MTRIYIKLGQLKEVFNLSKQEDRYQKYRYQLILRPPFQFIQHWYQQKRAPHGVGQNFKGLMILSIIYNNSDHSSFYCKKRFKLHLCNHTFMYMDVYRLTKTEVLFKE